MREVSSSCHAMCLTLQCCSLASPTLSRNVINSLSTRFKHWLGSNFPFVEETSGLKDAIMGKGKSAREEFMSDAKKYCGNSSFHGVGWLAEDFNRIGKVY